MYGRVVAFYNNNRIQGSVIRERFESRETMKDHGTMQLPDSESETLQSAVRNIDTNVREEFEQRFAAWKDTWAAPHTAHLSDPSFVQYNEEFFALAELGERIIPLLINKLLDPDNFFALQIYDAIQPESTSVVPIEPEEHDLILEGEQGRARRTVRRWLSNQ